jgi:hypothetical protein
MGQLFSSGALPIGLLMFLGSALAFALRKSGHRQAVKAFPALASELGLSFVAPRYSDAQGTLVGELGGRRVHVDPDEQQRILVRFKPATPASAVALDLRTYEHSLRAPFGMITLYTNDREFDRFFRTRFASEALAARLADVQGLAESIAPFRGPFARNLRGLSITSEGVTLTLDFGRPQHIPAEAVRELLPACIELVELIESSALDAALQSESVSSLPPSVS